MSIFRYEKTAADRAVQYSILYFFMLIIHINRLSHDAEF
jgi:hypothetical protein